MKDELINVALGGSAQTDALVKSGNDTLLLNGLARGTGKLKVCVCAISNFWDLNELISYMQLICVSG